MKVMMDEKTREKRETIRAIWKDARKMSREQRAYVTGVADGILMVQNLQESETEEKAVEPAGV